MAGEAARGFEVELNELNSGTKSRVQINLLTYLAEDYKEHAESITKVIERHILQASADRKLPALYVMDSIVKAIQQSRYAELFTVNLVDIFSSVFEKTPVKKRQSLYKLRLGWKEIFPNKVLYDLDIKVKTMDPAWPVTAKPPTVDQANVKGSYQYLTQLISNAQKRGSSEDLQKLETSASKRKKENIQNATPDIPKPNGLLPDTSKKMHVNTAVGIDKQASLLHKIKRTHIVRHRLSGLLKQSHVAPRKESQECGVNSKAVNKQHKVKHKEHVSKPLVILSSPLPCDIAVPDLSSLDKELLSQKYNSVVNDLYTGVSCKSCSQRFNDESSQKYLQHMAWHERRHRESTSSETRNNTEWYQKPADWIKFEETTTLPEDDYKGSTLSSEQQTSCQVNHTKTENITESVPIKTEENNTSSLNLDDEENEDKRQNTS